MTAPARISFRLSISTSPWWRGRLRPNATGPILLVEALSQIYEDDNVLYNVPLLDLEPNEYNLDSGRFQYFTHDPQDYKVVLDSFTRKEELPDLFGWLGANTRHSWSLQVSFHHISSSTFTWSFANATDATLFKLTWA